MANWMGGSAPAMAAQVAGGFVLVSSATLKGFNRPRCRPSGRSSRSYCAPPAPRSLSMTTPWPSSREITDSVASTRRCRSSRTSSPSDAEKATPPFLSIGLLDLAVIVVYMMGVILFGLWVGRGQRGAADYMLGGRDLPWWALLLSIVATETSTVTFLSIPGSHSPTISRGSSSRQECSSGSSWSWRSSSPLLRRGVLHCIRRAAPPLRWSHGAGRFDALHGHPQPGRRPSPLSHRSRAPGALGPAVTLGHRPGWRRHRGVHVLRWDEGRRLDGHHPVHGVHARGRRGPGAPRVSPARRVGASCSRSRRPRASSARSTWASRCPSPTYSGRV